MRTRLAVSGSIALLALGASRGIAVAQGTSKPVTLLNVSYDPTRELY
jgi:ABC-type sulfate transport system substrate-binding protein